MWSKEQTGQDGVDPSSLNEQLPGNSSAQIEVNWIMCDNIFLILLLAKSGNTNGEQWKAGR